jgi:DNA-binding CsgD family transcriptional regulator/GAF domain-containing protein
LHKATIEELTEALVELEQLERELVEQRYVRRSDGRDRALEALSRLAEIGSPEGLIARSAHAFGESSEFDLVLVSRYATPELIPLTCWSAEGDPQAEATLAELNTRPLALSYPLVEHEVIERQRAEVVSTARAGPRAAPALVDIFGWRSYVVAPIVLEGKTAGLLHASRLEHRVDVDEIDLELAVLFAEGFAQTFERATLKALLRGQKHNLQSAGRWITAHIIELSTSESFSATIPTRDAPDALDPLTTRELEVMRLIAQGMSNREIGKALVLGDGTVKYHVKNILRKLRAHSRTEAITIYARAGLAEHQ